MRTFLIIISFFSTLISFADAGTAYRFSLDLVTKNGDTLNGYYYHYTYDDFNYNHYDEGFKKFIKKDSIDIYSFITTVNVGSIGLDFTTENYKRTISLNNMDRIRISDCLNFEPEDRLKILNQSEFNLIRLYPPKTKKLYNENVAENCCYFLLSWNKESKVSKHAIEIINQLQIFGEDVIKNQTTFYDYFSLKKKEMLLENILTIDYCVPL